MGLPRPPRLSSAPGSPKSGVAQENENPWVWRRCPLLVQSGDPGGLPGGASRRAVSPRRNSWCAGCSLAGCSSAGWSGPPLPGPTAPSPHSPTSATATPSRPCWSRVRWMSPPSPIPATPRCPSGVGWCCAGARSPCSCPAPTTLEKPVSATGNGGGAWRIPPIPGSACASLSEPRKISPARRPDPPTSWRAKGSDALVVASRRPMELDRWRWPAGSTDGALSPVEAAPQGKSPGGC